MNASRAEIFALWKKKIPQVFQKRSRSGDLAARLAAPQSFIYKEMRGQLFPMNLQWETRKKENYDCSSKKTTKTTVFHWQKTEKKFTTKKKEEDKEDEGERKRKRESRVRKKSARSWTEWLRSSSTPGCSQLKRSIRFGESPLKKVPKSLYLSLSLSCQKDDANITSKLTDEIFNQISPRAIPPTFLRH